MAVVPLHEFLVEVGAIFKREGKSMGSSAAVERQVWVDGEAKVCWGVGGLRRKHLGLL